MSVPLLQCHASFIVPVLVCPVLVMPVRVPSVTPTYDIYLLTIHTLVSHLKAPVSRYAPMSV